MASLKIDCSAIKSKKEYIVEKNGFFVKIFHNDKDSARVNRIIIENRDMKIELLPSKGLSINEAFYRGKPFFWEPPMKALPDPEDFNPFEKMFIGGELKEGFSWLKQFTGGVEMLGLENWGMPSIDSESGVILPMHGTASLIPIDNVEIEFGEENIEISGKFEVRKIRPDDLGNAAIESVSGSKTSTKNIPWYKKGNPLFEVTKRVMLKPAVGRIVLRDTIKNVSAEPHFASWGYHVQMRAEEGAEYLIPSKSMKGIDRYRNQTNTEIWYNPKKENVREQIMNRHFEPEVINALLGGESGVRTLLRYPDGHAIMAVLPACPWIASWRSAGGKGGDEWCLAASESEKGPSIMNGNYSGIGPEYGSSDLFAGDDEDKQYREAPLKPSESTDIVTAFEMLTSAQACVFEDGIRHFNSGRKIG